MLIDELKPRTDRSVPVIPDNTSIELFSVKGFKLAMWVAETLANSQMLPPQFRTHVIKYNTDGTIKSTTENPAAVSNCLVAIEVARALGMSIVSVAQNAYVVEGRLSWSGQFMIACVNASRRFTPLRFKRKDLGEIDATYTEYEWKDGANGRREKVAKKNTVRVRNIEVTAFAYVLDEHGRKTDDLVEGSPVSMLMAVEEGWYGKNGSKWQTSLREQMLMYRSGTFFARIYAPDISMGLGQTTDEIEDARTIETAIDPKTGAYTSVDELNASVRAAKAETSAASKAADTPKTAAEAPKPDPKPSATPEPTASKAESPEPETARAESGAQKATETDKPGAKNSDEPEVSLKTLVADLNAAKKADNKDALDVAASLIQYLPTEDDRTQATAIFKNHAAAMSGGGRTLE